MTTLLDAGAMHPVQLQLSGLPDAFQQYSGPYYRVEAPPERRLSFGRPVYRSGGCWLFFAEDAGNEKGETAREGAAPTAQWIVGREEDVGRTHGWMYVDDEAASPELIRAEWQLWQGPRTTTVACQAKACQEHLGLLSLTVEVHSLGVSVPASISSNELLYARN